MTIITPGGPDLQDLDAIPNEDLIYYGLMDVSKYKNMVNTKYTINVILYLAHKSSYEMKI